MSFERLAQELAEGHQLLVMDANSTSTREQAFQGKPLLRADRP